MYGYDAEVLKQSKSLPWGDAVEESIPGWQVWEHGWEFTKGFFVDGVWGTLKGLGGLVGFQGWDTFKQSWTGLAKLGTGLAIMSIPGAGAVFLAAPDDKLPSWLRESRTAMKETGKALLVWDRWGLNPGRAAGAVTFNVVRSSPGSRSSPRSRPGDGRRTRRRRRPPELQHLRPDPRSRRPPRHPPGHHPRRPRPGQHAQ